MAGRVFISYRRADTAQAASWLFNRLTGHYGRTNVVMDVDPAPYGGNLAHAIDANVAACDAFVVLIGQHWLAVTGEGLHDPNDYVRLALESALRRGTLVVPVTVDGARMPVNGELPPSLASMAGQPAFEVGLRSFDADTGQLMRVLDQSIAERQVTQLGPAPGLTPPPGAAAPSTPAPGPLPYSTKPLPPRRRLGTRTLILAGAAVVVVAAAVVFAVIPRGHSGASASGGASASSSASGSPSAAATHRGSASPKAPASAGGGAANVILTDDFSTQRTGWTDDAHQGAGTYTGGGYRLSVTGANGVSEIARPVNATNGLGEMTPMNLSATVDVRKLSGAPQGYGLGIAFRSDGGGNVYAFLIEDHAVAIQKWTGGGAEVSDSPDPVTTSALHADGSDRLRAVVQTAGGGQAVHLELWLNGKKLVDYTDQDRPYTQGYLGLYVESISDASSTAGAQFDNFSAARL
ncbi:MAG TPA: toll/interleukin-1 receptor domain-containing protein [Streptosporangiaceae bacterium]|nr:toll/interleukin-1 receptor domain-containing protein [Streptosporangiaceae bacterium]